MDYKKSVIGGIVAFIIATSCCWIPALAIVFGGGSAFLAISSGLETLSSLFVFISFLLLGIGFYQFYIHKKGHQAFEVTLESTITCPSCNHRKDEIMPRNACQYFYECEHCNSILRPKENDCCVFCSYGSMVCPPIQLDENCC